MNVFRRNKTLTENSLWKYKYLNRFDNSTRKITK